MLTERFQRALAKAFGDEYADADPVIRPSQFADFQANAALALAKKLGDKPRDVAQRIVEHLDLDGVAGAPEISGPGFVNVRLADAWIAAELSGLDDRLGVPVQAKQVIPVDYSAPNVAKEMHVGHLRTTVVGDALVRTLEHLGHDVVRQNHVGDWGTPFGMLIEHLLAVGEDSPDAQLLVTDPNAFYAAAREEFDGDAEFADRARTRVVALQAGDPDTLRLWDELVDLSKLYFNRIYSTLGVTLTDADLAGESTYNAELAQICDELEAAGLATMSDGALCVFLDGYTGREGKPVPLIIRKSDGGYGYATTDLATIRHRVRDLHSDRILYVIGAPQALHLNMVWDTARKAGWLPDDVEVVHVQIGNVLGPDRKILRTREGTPLKLMELLEEAIARAREVVDEARPDLDPGSPGGDRTPGGHRRREVRRPVGRARQRVRLRPRPDGLAHRQHRALPPVRRGADPLDLPHRRHLAGRRDDSDRPHRAGGARARPRPAGVRRGRRRTSVTCSSRTGSAATSSTWPSTSRRSTSSARCSRPTPRSAPRGWRSARPPSPSSTRASTSSGSAVPTRCD